MATVWQAGLNSTYEPCARSEHPCSTHRQTPPPGAGTGGWLTAYCMIRSGLVRGSQATHGEASEVAGAPLIRLAYVVGRCSDASPCGVCRHEKRPGGATGSLVEGLCGLSENLADLPVDVVPGTGETRHRIDTRHDAVEGSRSVFRDDKQGDGPGHGN